MWNVLSVFALPKFSCILSTAYHRHRLTSCFVTPEVLITFACWFGEAETHGHKCRIAVVIVGILTRDQTVFAFFVPEEVLITFAFWISTTGTLLKSPVTVIAEVHFTSDVWVCMSIPDEKCSDDVCGSKLFICHSCRLLVPQTKLQLRKGSYLVCIQVP